MTETYANPPHWAQALLGCLSRRSDRESILGDLLEEYREVRRPRLGRFRADAWYVRNVLSLFWRVFWPCVLPMLAVKMTVGLLGDVWAGLIPSLIRLPNVSALDAVALFWAGYYGSRRTGLIRTGVLTSCATSVAALAVLFAYVILTQDLLPDLRAKSFIWVIMSTILAVSVSFAIAMGALGGVVGRWSAPIRPRSQGA